jgi:hypothetical protein
MLPDEDEGSPSPPFPSPMTNALLGLVVGGGSSRALSNEARAFSFLDHTSPVITQRSFNTSISIESSLLIPHDATESWRRMLIWMTSQNRLI